MKKIETGKRGSQYRSTNPAVRAISQDRGLDFERRNWKLVDYGQPRAKTRQLDSKVDA
jgi:hypothetical protein